MTDEQHINGVPVRPRVRTEYDDFYDRESGPSDDYTWGEVCYYGGREGHRRDIESEPVQVIED